jgi:hypothetical protein
LFNGTDELSRPMFAGVFGERALAGSLRDLRQFRIGKLNRVQDIFR